MAVNRRSLVQSIAESRAALDAQGADLEKQGRLITAMEQAGEDVSDIKEMHDLLIRMHGIARRRLDATSAGMEKLPPA